MDNMFDLINDDDDLGRNQAGEEMEALGFVGQASDDRGSEERNILNS